MNSKYIGIAATVSVLVLAGCSSSSDDGANQTVEPGDLIVGVSASGTVADDVTTEDLRRSAATLASSSLGLNINQVLGIGFASADTPTSPDGPDTTTMITVGDGIANGDMLDDNVDSLMSASLALDSTTATITREGNIITIDPDENELCKEEVLGQMVAADATSDASCIAVYKDLLVVLDAKTDDTGIVTYQFQNQPLLAIGYSPNGGSYEINMGGLKAVLEAAAAQDPNTTVDLPDTMQGAMRITAVVNDASGTVEAGSMSIAVTQPISIIDAGENINLSLANSELFNVSSDEDGNTKISSSYGALSASFPALLDDTDPLATMDIVGLMASGVSSQIAINKAGDEATFGGSGGTFSVAINSGNAVNLSISNYAMTVNSERLTIDQGLTLGLNMTNVVSQLTTGFNTAEFNLAMPTGTVLEEAASGAAKVTAGAFSYNLNANTAQGAVSSSFAASAGQCIGSAPTDPANDQPNDQPLVVVSCDAP